MSLFTRVCYVSYAGLKKNFMKVIFLSKEKSQEQFCKTWCKAHFVMNAISKYQKISVVKINR